MDSTQLVWIADYFADTTLPSRTTSLSFSFANAWESGFSIQSNVDLHITFDFDGFDVIFFLYTKYPGSSFPYNTTVGGNHFVHYLINSSWGSGWQDIGQIDLSTALIELGMYTESSLPSYFMFNEMRVEALAYDPFKLHLLVDNISVISDLNADSAGLTVNTTEFTNEVCNINGYVQNEKNEGIIGFEIQSNRYDKAKIELNGHLIFDIRFILDNLSHSDEYYFVNGNYIGWLVKFNVYKPQDDSFQIYNIHINTPVEWNAISLIDSDGNDQIKQIDTEERINSTVLILNKPYLKAGQFTFKAYGPNYITEIIAPHTTNHSLQLPLHIKTLQVLGVDMLIQVEKLPNNEVIASKTIFQVITPLYSTIIEFNETITSGQYRLTAQIQSDLRVGIRFHDFNVTTDMAVIQILSGNTVDIFEDYTLSVQCLDIPNASKIENAYVIYSWELGNGTLSYDKINHTYWTNIRTNYSNGNYSLVVHAYADGYVFTSHKLNLQILETKFRMDLSIPENISISDTIKVGVTLEKSNGELLAEIPIFVYLDGVYIADANTTNNGQSEFILFSNFKSETDVNVTVIALWEGKMLTTSSKIVHISNNMKSDEVTSEVTTPLITTPSTTNLSDPTNIEHSDNSSKVYFFIGFLLLITGIGFLIRKHSRSKHESFVNESDHANVPNDIEKEKYYQINSTKDVNQTSTSTLFGVSGRLRGVQSVNEFATELGLSSNELIQLINSRNTQVSKENQWKIVANDQLIIPPNSKAKKDN